MSINKKGFSIIGLMVAGSVISILVVGFMGFVATSFDSQQKIIQLGDIHNLKNEIGMLVDSEKHCRNSLAGSGKYGLSVNATTFKKKDIDEDTEGLDVELYTSSQDGNSRSTKIFSAIDPKVKFYGTLEILSIKFLMNTGKVGVDYSASNEHEDIGTLRIKVKGLKKEVSFDIRLRVWMRTDSDQKTSLLSCSRSLNSVPKCGTAQTFHPICGCIIKGKAGYTGSECVVCSKTQTWDPVSSSCSPPPCYYKKSIKTHSGKHPLRRVYIGLEGQFLCDYTPPEPQQRTQ